MKKKIALLMACTMAAASLAGCGGGNTAKETTAAAAAPAGDVAMTMFWWGNQVRNERTQAALDLYSETNGVKLDGQFAEWSDYWNKLATSAAGHAMPDVVQMDYMYLNQYASSNLLVAAVLGGLWGAIPGFFKAYFNINEVITSIMFNWIGLYLVNELVYQNGTGPMYDVRNTRTLNLGKNADFAQSIIPDFGLNKLFQTNSTTIAIFLAAVVAILVWVVLNKTTFGYELKAVGLNKSAARYAGINEKKNIILSMAIAGALAGFGAGLFYLSNVGQWNPLNSTSLPAMGFNGISVALLASSNPIGTIFSAIFISHISVGGTFLSTKYYPTEIADLISGIIIYLCAFSMLFRGKIQKLLFKNADKTNVNAEPAPAEKANAKKEGK